MDDEMETDIDNEYFNEISKSIEFKENNIVNTCICSIPNIREDIKIGANICINCGYVLEYNFDNSPEWKQDGEEKTISRCTITTNPLLPNIGYTGFMHSGRLGRLYMWLSVNYKYVKLKRNFNIIQNACDKGNISTCVAHYAMLLYKTIYDNNPDEKMFIARGENHIGISSGCLYIACEVKGSNRTILEIAQLYNVSTHVVNNGHKNVLKLLKTKNCTIKIVACEPEKYIKRICDKMGIFTEYTNKAIRMAKNITILINNEILNCQCHSSYSIAIAVVFLMAEFHGMKNITKKLLAKNCMISEVTISKAYKKIIKFKNSILSDDILSLFSGKLNKSRNMNWLDNVHKLDIDDNEFFDSDVETEPFVVEHNVDINDIKK